MTIVFGQLVNEFNSWAAGTLSPDDLRSAVNKYSLYFVFLFIGKFLCVYIHTSCFTLTATRATRQIRYSYIRALLRQDIAYFDTCSPGAVATSISNNADMIQTGMGEKVGVACQSLAMLLSAFIVAFTAGWKLTLVTATTLPAAVLGVGITVALDAKQETKILAIYATAAGLVEESLSSVRNVIALGANAKFQKRYDGYLDQAKVFGVKKGPILGVQYSSEFFVMHCAYALSFWYGVTLLLKGEMSDGGQVVTVLFSVIIGTSSLTMIAPAIGDFTKAGAAAKSVIELIRQEPTIDPISTEGIRLEKNIEGSITIKNVTFAYPARPTMNVLDNVSMQFEAQKTTAIVGASGSGKSTIVALLERWYDPAAGELELDGHNIKALNVHSLRSHIGLVQQEPVLFNGTCWSSSSRELLSKNFC
jgi:ATP-binding cassette subfamily B (MDR/TAP) protein 1